jgi:RND family efflux transporter MFP subunit
MLTITKRRLFLAVLPLLLSCGEGSAVDDHGHPHDGDEAVDHGNGGGSTLVYTHYTDTTELFVEFPPLVAGRSSTFAAHVTRLVDHEPMRSGRLDVMLLRDGKLAARFRVSEPSRAGIFTPAVTPRDPGRYELVLDVADGNVAARHDLGEVTVFPEPAAVETDQTELEGDIAYLKEQQWSNPFAAVVVQPQPLRASVPGYATVLPPADAGAEIHAPADGYIAPGSLRRSGQAVDAGDTLGILIPRLGEGSDLGELAVALERARSQQSLAERDVDRLQGLVAKGAVPERRLEEARQALEVANAELRAARSRLEQYQQGDDNAGIHLRAPVSGVVVGSSARPGAYVRQDDQLFLLAAPDRRWLEVRVPERFVGALANASGAWFDVDGEAAVTLDVNSGARVVQTGMAIDPTTRTASVTVEYPISQGPGAIGTRFAAHVFTEAPTERLAIPRSAVIDDGGRPVVYVQTGGETFARRPVELGVVDGSWVQAIGGVAAGERVVSEGAYLVKLAASGGEEIGHGHAH